MPTKPAAKRTLLRKRALPTTPRRTPRELAEALCEHLTVDAIVGDGPEVELTLREASTLRVVIDARWVHFFVVPGGGPHRDEEHGTLLEPEDEAGVADDVDAAISAIFGIEEPESATAGDFGDQDDAHDDLARAVAETLLARGLVELVSPRSKTLLEAALALRFSEGRWATEALVDGIVECVGVAELLATDEELGEIVAAARRLGASTAQRSRLVLPVAACGRVGADHDFSEDAFLAASFGGPAPARPAPADFAGVLAADAGVVLAVIDGFGGTAGAALSEVVTAALWRSLGARLRANRTPEAAVVEALASANEALRARAAQHGQLRGAGASFAVALLVPTSGGGARVLFAAGGDTFGGLLRAGELTPLASPRTASIDPGPDEAAPPPTLLGSDLGDVSCHAWDLVSGDRLILCSNGLHFDVEPRELAAVLGAATQPEAACAALAARVPDAADDVTIVTAYVP